MCSCSHVIQIEVVELLAPEHARQRLAVHPPFIFTQRSRRDPFIELIGIGAPAFEDLVETAEGISYLGGRQTQADGLAAAAGNVERIVGRGLGPGLGWIYCLALSRDDVFVERILDVGRPVGLIPQTLRITFIFSEEQLRGAIAMEPILAKLMVRRLNGHPDPPSRSDGFG